MNLLINHKLISSHINIIISLVISYDTYQAGESCNAFYAQQGAHLYHIFAE